MFKVKHLKYYANIMARNIKTHTQTPPHSTQINFIKENELNNIKALIYT